MAFKNLAEFSNEQRAVVWLRAVPLFDQNQLTPLSARELKYARFCDADGNRRWTDFNFNLPSHNYIHITKFIFFNRDE